MVGIAWVVRATQAKNLLLEAAKNKGWYKNTATAEVVAQFLSERLNDKLVSRISYRTLQMGYELAKDHPDSWKDLLLPAIPSELEDPEILVKDLAKKKLKVKEQARIFEEMTGLKRRTFFKYRSRAQSE